jgi:hypothetical protein
VRTISVNFWVTLIVILAAAAALQMPAWGDTCAAVSAVQQPSMTTVNADLELARKFAALGDWKDAEAHFAAAAKDPASQREALACIEVARHNEDIGLLQTGQIYESEHQWLKAQDLYRAAAADPSSGNEARKVLDARLAAALQAERRENRWAEWKEWIKNAAEAIVFCLALIILSATVRSILKSRRTILVHPFIAPTDELAKGLNGHLKYAWAMMQNPALSAAGQVPVPLVENALQFADEFEPIEDLEIAGSKVPFASLAKIFGRPSIRVSGGFDAVAPLGTAYSVVTTPDGRADSFVQRTIRVGVPDQQRHDLLDFAYDVIIRVCSAYANV